MGRTSRNMKFCRRCASSVKSTSSIMLWATHLSVGTFTMNSFWQQNAHLGWYSAEHKDKFTKPITRLVQWDGHSELTLNWKFRNQFQRKKKCDPTFTPVLTPSGDLRFVVRYITFWLHGKRFETWTTSESNLQFNSGFASRMTAHER